MALAPDPTRAPRDAYTRCLRAFMEKSVADKMSLEAFTAAFPQQCTEQEQAYRAAVRAFQSGQRVSASDIDEILKDEVDGARENMKERFVTATTPA